MIWFCFSVGEKANGQMNEMVSEQVGAPGGAAEVSADLRTMGARARAASRKLATLTTAAKDAALARIADAIEAQAETILAQNALDLSLIHISEPTRPY